MIYLQKFVFGPFSSIFTWYCMKYTLSAKFNEQGFRYPLLYKFYVINLILFNRWTLPSSLCWSFWRTWPRITSRKSTQIRFSTLRKIHKNVATKRLPNVSGKISIFLQITIGKDLAYIVNRAKWGIMRIVTMKSLKNTYNKKFTSG